MEDDPQEGAGPRAVRVLLPFATAFVSLMIGAIVGGGLAWVLKRPVEVEKIVEKPRDYTAQELDQACASRVDEVVKQLTEANAGITTLEADVKAKTEKVASLEAEIKKRGAAGKALTKQLEQARAELTEVKTKLEQAIAEKEAIAKTLEVTRERLVKQALQTDEARAESRGHRFSSFLAEGQLQICERGNRKKLGKCREAVEASLKRYAGQYEHCLASGQEAPTLAEVTDIKDTALPPFASWLNNDDKIVRGWYVLLCDPNLPVAPTSAADVAAELMNEQAATPGAVEPAKGDALFENP